MCYPKPGPRCSAHAAEHLVKAKALFKQMPTFEHADLVENAQLEYDATPAGMRELERRIKQYSGNQETEYEMRLTRGKLHRSEALALLKATDNGDLSHNRKEEKAYPAEFHSLTKKYRNLKDKETLPGIPDESEVTSTIIEDSTNWVSSLTTDEIEAASWYTSDGAHTVNRYLGNPDNDSFSQEELKQITQTIKNLDSALEKSKREKPIKVYRGVSTEVLEAQGYKWGDSSKYVEDNFVVGDTFSTPVFMSSTLDAKKASQFSTPGIVLEILARKAGNVTNVSAWGLTEKEFILPRNTEYRVIAIKTFSRKIGEKYSHKTKVIQLEEI